METATIRNTTGYIFMAVFAIFIGLYPLRFIGLPYEEGILGSKPIWLVENKFYLLAFYVHVFLGGTALISGFSQFFPKLRKKKLGLHRTLGKIYVLAVFLSGIAGLIIAYFATGGIIPVLGFGGLALFWLYTTANAYLTIRKKLVVDHQKWMIRSYALCFAAVTLRIYLPIFIGFFEMGFIPSYKIIAWLCWVPNLLIAEFLIIRKMKLKTTQT